MYEQLQSGAPQSGAFNKTPGGTLRREHTDKKTGIRECEYLKCNRLVCGHIRSPRHWPSYLRQCLRSIEALFPACNAIYSTENTFRCSFDNFHYGVNVLPGALDLAQAARQLVDSSGDDETCSQ